MSAQEPSSRAGAVDRLAGSVSGLLASMVTIGRTRLELLTVEIREELQWTASLVLWAAIAFLAAGFTLLFAGLTLIFVFWETHRLLAGVLVTAGFAAVAVVGLVRFRGRLAGRPRLLGTTLRELATDADRLRARAAGHGDAAPRNRAP